MKNQLLFVLAAMFAIVFVFGCIGGGEEETEGMAGAGYTLNVNPQQVIAGGVITVDLRLQNIFEKDMENVVAEMTGLPKGKYTGAEEPIEIGTIVAGQEFPAIWTIETPDTEIKQTITPTIEVCFDYTTDFFFDTSIRPKELAAEEVSLQSSYSSGPITVSQIGLDNIFIKEGDTTSVAGSLNIQNNWQGKIKKINKISIDVSTDGLISDATIGYAKCGGTDTEITPSGTDCDILENELAIGDGITGKITITLDSGASTDTIEIERINGKAEYTYCYDIPVGTITVCPVGQRC